MNVCNLLLLFCLPHPVRLCEREHTFPPQRPSALKPFVELLFFFCWFTSANVDNRCNCRPYESHHTRLNIAYCVCASTLQIKLQIQNDLYGRHGYTLHAHYTHIEKESDIENLTHNIPIAVVVLHSCIYAELCFAWLCCAAERARCNVAIAKKLRPVGQSRAELIS